MMNQNVNGDAERVTAAGRDHIEINHPNINRQNEPLLGGFTLRYHGLEITGSGLTGVLMIGGTIYFGDVALNRLLSSVLLKAGHVLFRVVFGSYIIHVITDNAQSKQALLEQVTSKALEKKLGDIFDTKVEVHLVEVGAVIATEEEFAQLKKHMEKKLKKVQFKIDNNCKGTMEDFCCTMPIFKNKSRFLIHKVTRDTENDIIECLKNNLEFVKPDEESLLQTAHEKNNAKVKQQGFLVQHPGYSKFSETFQSHPGLQEMVVEVIDTVEELVKQNYVMKHQVEAKKLLEFNPILFTGNCEMVTRKLAKFAKTFMFEKDFEITKSLLVWMIKLCNNIMDDKRIGRLLLFFLKLIDMFLDFVSKSDQHLRGKDYARELYGVIRRCAETNIKDGDLLIYISYNDLAGFGSDGSDFSDWYFRLNSIIGAMTKQSGKNCFKLLHYHLKRLLLIARNYDFEKYRMAIYSRAIPDLLKVAKRVVEVSHSQCVRMVAEILEILRSKSHWINDPLFGRYPTPMHQILLSYFNTIHEILESRKKSECDNSSIFVLLFTIYKLLLLYNDQSAKPLPVTELSSCVLRLCYYHTYDNGELPHELSVSEIFNSGSKLLKQVTEQNKAAKKFKIYGNNSSKFDEVSVISNFFISIALLLRSILLLGSEARKVFSNLKSILSFGKISSGYGRAALSSGHESSTLYLSEASIGLRDLCMAYISTHEYEKCLDFINRIKHKLPKQPLLKELENLDDETKKYVEAMDEYKEFKKLFFFEDLEHYLIVTEAQCLFYLGNKENNRLKAEILFYRPAIQKTDALLKFSTLHPAMRIQSLKYNSLSKINLGKYHEALSAIRDLFKFYKTEKKWVQGTMSPDTMGYISLCLVKIGRRQQGIHWAREGLNYVIHIEAVEVFLDKFMDLIHQVTTLSPEELSVGIHL